MTAAALTEQLAAQERYLLHHDHSRDPDALEALLAPGLVEVDVHGRRIGREAVVHWLLSKPVDARWELEAVDIMLPCEGLALLSYVARQVAGGGSGRPGRHSSLWRRSAEGSWQLCFHQATRIISQGE